MHTSTQFSSLSFPPRCNIALLLVGVFALRWTDRHFCAYLSAFFLSLVHLATSGLVLALMVATDLLIRPSLFRRPQILAANKMDLPQAQANLQSFRERVGQPVIPVSCATGAGMPELLETVWRQLQASAAGEQDV